MEFILTMKVLIISKVPTHPTSMGNMWAVLAQAEAIRSLGVDVFFLYVHEKALRKIGKSKEPTVIETQKYWGDRFLYYNVPLIEKLCFNTKMHLRRIFCKDYHPVDEAYPYGLSSFVEGLQKKEKFDVCIVNYIFLSKLLTKVKFPKSAIHTHDSMAYKEMKIGESCKSMTASEEAKGLQRTSHIFALQDEEAVYFKFLSPLSHIYTIYSIYHYVPHPIAGNHNIMFLSGNNGFNQNGIKWFIKEVFPLVLKRFPDAKLKIGGGICKVMPELKNVEGVDMLGYVDSVNEFYKLGDVAINPVYQGTGLKIKTFEALSYDKVTLVHPHSMAGVYKKDEAPLFASEKPEEWVKFLETVWDNPKHIEEIKKQNADYMKEMNEFIISEYKRFLEA